MTSIIAAKANESFVEPNVARSGSPVSVVVVPSDAAAAATASAIHESVLFATPTNAEGVPDLNVWTKLQPQALYKHAKHNMYGEPSMEVNIEWDMNDQVAPVVDQVVSRVSPFFPEWTNEDKMNAKALLQANIKGFQVFCNEHFEPQHRTGYRVRLICMVGNAGTTCPAWHQDHVPIRWLQTLKGPGTEYIDPGLHYPHNPQLKQVMENFVPVEVKTRVIDKESGIRPSQLETGQAAIFVGRTWSRYAKTTPSPSPGVLHRSPQKVGKHETRVLFSLDSVGTRDGPEDDACDLCPCGDDHHHDDHE